MASRRNYTTAAEVEALTSLGDVTSAEITDAENWVDRWAGFIDAFFAPIIRNVRTFEQGEAVSEEEDGTSEITVDDHPMTDYFAELRVLVVGGAGKGQERRVISSTSQGVLTTVQFTTELDSTSVIRIFQPGKFPRACDVSSLDSTYYKTIPQRVKDAVAYQVQFMRARGADYFTGDEADIVSESTGDHSWQKGGTGTGLAAFLAPRARDLLHGIRNIKGQFED